MESQARLCLVDDDRAARSYLGDLLGELGYRVDQYDGPASFLAACTAVLPSLKPDLFLFDVEMPVMNGFELCRILKKMKGLKGIPVIFLSGLSNETAKAEGYESGGIDYITKPYVFEEVKARIAKHLKLVQ